MAHASNKLKTQLKKKKSWVKFDKANKVVFCWLRLLVKKITTETIRPSRMKVDRKVNFWPETRL